jgi:D-serine deaminase-like pyridoxal phosphate-dependent protein
MTRDDIPTPALLLDLDRFERNLRRMAAHARASGKNLGPTRRRIAARRSPAVR